MIKLNPSIKITKTEKVMKKENKIQQEIIIWFRNTQQEGVIFSVPNEGSNPAEQMYKKSLGMLAGCSDLVLVQKNKITFVECKDEKGVQSEKQKIFEKNVNNLGFDYIICRSLENFINFVKKKI